MPLTKLQYNVINCQSNASNGLLGCQKGEKNNHKNHDHDSTTENTFLCFSGTARKTNNSIKQFMIREFGVTW